MTCLRRIGIIYEVFFYYFRCRGAFSSNYGEWDCEKRIVPKKERPRVLPMLIQDYLDICDPELTFERFMEKYLKNIPQHYTGRLRYDPVSMLKTVLFGFMANGYISLRELEDQCKVNLRFMYLMDHQAPSYRTFGYFINEVLAILLKNKFNGTGKIIHI